MRTRTTVNVSKADILLGMRCSCSFCPIARAISRKLGQSVRVTVGHPGGAYFRFDVGLGYLSQPRNPLPPKCRQFIADFDTGKSVQPFSFTLFQQTA